MIISSVDFAAVARAATEMVKDFQAIQDIDARVERAEQVNEDPGLCPWVGIYPTRGTFPPRALGFGAGFRGQEPEFIAICQASHPNDGAACQDSLGELVKAVADAILSDPSLKGTVLTLADFEVSFDDYRKVDDVIMQSATIRVVGQTTVSGG